MFLVLFYFSFLLHVAGRPIPASVRFDQKFFRREPLETAHTDSEHGTKTVSDEALMEAVPVAGASTSACATNQLGYAVLSDNTLLLIDMGPSTMSGRTEIRGMEGSDGYRNFVEDNPVQSGMHLTANANNNGEWTFLADFSDNLYAINRATSSEHGKVELHRLKYDQTNPYQELDMNVITVQPKQDGWQEMDFLLDSSSNLTIVVRGPSTASGSTEVHKLAAKGFAAGEQGYQMSLPIMSTALPHTASTSGNGEWAFLFDGQDNLMAIRRPGNNARRITIVRLTAASHYQHSDLCCDDFPGEFGNIDACCPSVELPQAATDDVHWVFVIDNAQDLLCIKEGPTTSSAFTEIHKLSKVSNFTRFTLHETETAAPCRVPTYIDAAGER